MKVLLVTAALEGVVPKNQTYLCVREDGQIYIHSIDTLLGTSVYLFIHAVINSVNSVAAENHA